MSYEFLPHTADAKIRAEGRTLEEAFKQAALGLGELMYGGVKVSSTKVRKISVKGHDLESLLLEFLEEFIFLLEAKYFLFGKVGKIKIDKSKFTLEAEVWGDSASRYKFNNKAKAITYHEMLIKKVRGKWRIEFVVDI